MSGFFAKQALYVCLHCREKAARFNRLTLGNYQREVASGAGFVRSMQVSMAVFWACFGVAIVCAGVVTMVFGIVAWFDIKGFWFTNRFALAADISSALATIAGGAGDAPQSAAASKTHGGSLGWN